MPQMSIYKGKVTRTSALGIWVEVPVLGTDFEYGPLETTQGLQYIVGDDIVVGQLAGVAEDLIVLGKVGVGIGHTHDDRYYTEAEVDSYLSGKSNVGHTHTGNDITGTIDISKLPVAASGVSDATKLVRADDSRLTGGTAHTHSTGDVTSGIFDIARIPVADNNEVSATEVVRANDSRLSDARTPLTHTHDDRYYTETEANNLLNGKVPWDGSVHYSNPFGGKKLYFSQLHNGVFRADERWNVTGQRFLVSDGSLVNSLTAAEIALLFDGDYEGTVNIPVGQRLVLTFDFTPTTYFMQGAYPYGYFYIAHYYTSRSASASARVYTTYAPHGGPGWVALAAPTAYVDQPSQQIWSIYNGIYQIQTLEITIVAPASGAQAQITEIDFKPDRPGTTPLPVLDKYRANDLYSNTRWVQNRVVKAEIKQDGSATFTGSATVDGQALVKTNDSRLTDARTPLAHTHAAGDVNSGIFDIARIPVAASGISNTTQVVRADDARLSDARTPVAHSHAAGDVTSGTFAITRIPTGTTAQTVALGNHGHSLADAAVTGVLSVAKGGTGATDAATARTNLGAAATSHTHGIADLPVATSGEVSTTKVVRADDSRLSDARTPVAHTHNLDGIVAGGTLDIPLVQDRISTPSAAPTGSQALYPKVDGKYYVIGSDGVERPLVPVPDQLHSNPSFDSWSMSTDGSASEVVTSRPYPDSWDNFWGNPNGSIHAQLSADETVTREGIGRSMKVDHPVDTGQALQSTIWAVTSGSLITVSAWVRGTGPRCYITLLTSLETAEPTFFQAAGATAGTESPSIVPSTAWQKITVSFVVPANHTKCRMILRSYSDPANGGAAGVIWWDDTESSRVVTPPASVITGEIKKWPTTTAPDGYLLCDGSEKPVADYPTLDALLGTTFGARTNGSGAAGTTHFRLPKITAELPDTDWTNMTLLNGWTNYGGGFQPAQYRRKNGILYLRGLINGTGRTANHFATFTAGYQHDGGPLLWTCNSDNSSGTSRVDTTSGGALTLAGGTAGYLSLVGITYPVDGSGSLQYIIKT